MKKNKQKNTPPNSTPPIENSLGDFPKGKNEGFLCKKKKEKRNEMKRKEKYSKEEENYTNLYVCTLTRWPLSR